MTDVRKCTNELLEAVEEGLIDKDGLIAACLTYMSEDDVRDLCRCNGYDEIVSSANEN